MANPVRFALRETNQTEPTAGAGGASLSPPPLVASPQRPKRAKRTFRTKRTN